MKKMAKKTVIVTGGSRGIGLATAILFAKDDCNVAICARNELELQQAKEKIIAESGNPNILSLAGDISKETFVKLFFSETFTRFKSIDACINNAGCLITKPFIKISLNDWHSVMEVNATGVFLCCKEAFHYMQHPEKNSVIVNVSSLSGVRGVEKFPGMTAYIASKYTVVGLTESLAIEGKPFNISVNCVAPGAVDTKTIADNFSNSPVKTSPEKVANIIKFLANENEGEIVNGTIFEYFCN